MQGLKSNFKKIEIKNEQGADVIQIEETCSLCLEFVKSLAAAFCNKCTQAIVISLKQVNTKNQKIIYNSLTLANNMTEQDSYVLIEVEVQIKTTDFWLTVLRLLSVVRDQGGDFLFAHP